MPMFSLTKLFGEPGSSMVTSAEKLIPAINALEQEYEVLSDEELRAKTDAFRERLKESATLDDILPEAFAAVRESAKRTVKLRPFDVQLIGGIVLHRHAIAEMKTGEGKTL